MGLSYGVGIALSKKLKGQTGRVFVLLGDGELNEGSVWEAAMLAVHKKLNNLIAIVDRNNMQSDGFSKDILDINIQSIWNGYGWESQVCDGHNIEKLIEAFNSTDKNGDKPQVIIANTIKGKGVSFMENERAWHHAYMTDEQFQAALAEVTK